MFLLFKGLSNKGGRPRKAARLSVIVIGAKDTGRESPPCGKAVVRGVEKVVVGQLLLGLETVAEEREVAGRQLRRIVRSDVVAILLAPVQKQLPLLVVELRQRIEKIRTQPVLADQLVGDVAPRRSQEPVSWRSSRSCVVTQRVASIKLIITYSVCRFIHRAGVLLDDPYTTDRNIAEFVSDIKCLCRFHTGLLLIPFCVEVSLYRPLGLIFRMFIIPIFTKRCARCSIVGIRGSHRCAKEYSPRCSSVL